MINFEVCYKNVVSYILYSIITLSTGSEIYNLSIFAIRYDQLRILGASTTKDIRYESEIHSQYCRIILERMGSSEIGEI